MSEPVELRLYSPLQIDIIDRDISDRAIPLQAVSREHKEEYLRRVVRALGELQSQEDARHAFTAPQDLDAYTHWLVDWLMALGPEQALDFDSFVHGYRDAAYKYGLWNAASILCDGCTDDGFIDFRGWLIAQGRDVYMAALKDPDSMADVPVYGGCCFESLSYVGDYAYEKLTGRDSYDCFDPAAYQTLVAELEKDIVYGEGIEYPYGWWDVPSYLPKLCAKYMAPEELAWLTERRVDSWNQTSPGIQQARATAQKSKKIKKDRGDSR